MPQGGNTGLVQGSTPPVSSAAVLTFSSSSITIDLDTKQVHADAQATIEDLQEEAQKYGLYFPLSYGSKGTATIGGAVATNAGGMERRIHHLCQAYEAIDGRGKRVHHMVTTPPTLSDSVLPDPHYSFLGSQGYFGMVTHVSCRLIDPPSHRMAFWVPLSSLKQFNMFHDSIKGILGGRLDVLELMYDTALQDVRRLSTLTVPSSHDAPYTALVVCHSHTSQEDLLNEFCQATTGLTDTEQAGISVAESKIEEFIHAREAISDATRYWARQDNHRVLPFDLSCPHSTIYDQLDQLNQSLKKSIIKVNGFGHFCQDNHRVAMHYNVIVNSSLSETDIQSIYHHVYRHIWATGGSHSAEHGGLGDRTLPYTVESASRQDIESFIATKLKYDPKCIFQRDRFETFMTLASTRFPSI